MSSISFNGKTYAALEDMPATERIIYDQIMSVFVDADKNGMPDIFEGDIVKNVMQYASTSFVLDGHSVQSLNSLPPEVRSKVAQAFEKMKSMGLVSEDMLKMSTGGRSHVDAAAIRPSPPLIQISPVHSEVSPSRVWLLILIAILLVACAAAVSYLFLIFG